jgi:TolA-binding protein
MPAQSNRHRKSGSTARLQFQARLLPACLLALVIVAASSATPAYALDKQLQAELQTLQDAVARLQQANDERMGALKELVQQNVDSVNRMSVTVDALQKQVQTQVSGSSDKMDQVSGQIQSLNDTLDELKTRLAHLEKLTQDVQSQQQSMSANLQSLPQSGAAGAPAAIPDAAAANPEPPAPTTAAKGKKGAKPSPAIPMVASDIPPAVLPATAPTRDASVPPVDELYKTALGDYMTAKYQLADTEFGDVAKYYPDNALAGNAFYYQAEIDFRGAKYTSAVKNYDKVIDQYPDNNKVPVSHLHKGMALINMKQNDAGVRELRLLVQRYPNSPEAMSARSKLNGMGITPTPKKPATASEQ